jgi:WD40 repeat protein
VTSVAFSSDGKYVLTASDDATAIIWITQTADKVHTLRGYSDAVDTAQFSPDGKYILTGGWNGLPIVWDAKTGLQVTQLIAHNNSLTGTAFSPDGKYMLTAGIDGKADLWDAQSTQQVRTFHAHGFRSIAFSPDGKYFVGGNDDGTAILWDIRSETPVRIYNTRTKDVFSVAFSPDGKYILTGSVDGSTILWDSGITITQCGNSPPSKMIVGKSGHIIPGPPSRLRAQPDGTVIGSVPGDATFTVLRGPLCGADGIAWWQVNYNGQTGWLAEGEGSTYYLEP